MTSGTQLPLVLTSIFLLVNEELSQTPDHQHSLNAASTTRERSGCDCQGLISGQHSGFPLVRE